MAFPLLAAVIPAAVGAIGSMYAAYQGRRSAQEANKDRTPPELQDLRQQLASYYSEKGMEGTPYPGQMTAGPNPVLVAAMQSAMQNRNAGSAVLNDLLGRFASPSGAMGWSPTSTFSNRVAIAPVANQGRRTPDRPSNVRRGSTRSGS